MVAIDRLREVATRVEDGGECRRRGGLTCRSCLADELYGIADQMEREHLGDAVRAVSVPAPDRAACAAACARCVSELCELMEAMAWGGGRRL